ncbi:MAG: chloride channel protein, partial [Melioribacteraceae bacterium]|nr:chloride channel protein [Melioribacteraceae bacterium]
LKNKFSRLKLVFQKGLSSIPIPEYALFSIYAILTGAVVGLAAVVFHESILLITEISFNNTPDYLYFLIPAGGMLILSIMSALAPDISKRKGVSEVIKAVALRGGYIPFRTTLFHFIAPVLCIGTGNTVGPEGPAAQLGGGLSSKIGSILGLSDSRRRIFTAAGGGAVISAVFNSPLGGIFFALEIVLLNDFQTPTFSALVLASVTASAISRIFLGDTPTFIFDEISIENYNELYLFAILGMAAGLLSILFIRYSDGVERIFKDIILKKVPAWIPMVSIGLIMGLCGYYYDGIFGIGYSEINKILAGAEVWDVILILLLMKFILVPLILYSGGFGGLFAPSLFIGACGGFLYAFGLNYFFGTDLNTTTYVLVGMGAVLGGVNSIPISAILIIFEMTKDYTFILPLMLAVILSTIIVQVFLKGSIHIKHLEREGYKISSGRETNILRSIFVEDVMRNEVYLIAEDTSIGELINKLLEEPQATFYTINKNGELAGAISENELRPIITEYQHIRETLIASDIAKPEVRTVLKSDDLDHTLKLFGNSNVDQLPVVLRSDPLRPIGTIWRDDIINAYNQESLKHNLTDELAENLKRIEKTKISKVSEGYSIVEKRSIPSFVGRSLAELRLRNKFGLEVLMIKQQMDAFSDSRDEFNIIMPDPDYILKEDDILVMFGSDKNISHINNW